VVVVVEAPTVVEEEVDRMVEIEEVVMGEIEGGSTETQEIN